MKAIEHTLIRTGLGLGVLLLATSLCWGTESNAGSKQTPFARVKAAAKKQKSGEQPEPKLVEVTGSRLKYRVKAGQQSTATPLSVTVIDPKSAVNRGYSSPLEVLLRTPSVYRGR
jgi:hypothetical protein